MMKTFSLTILIITISVASLAQVNFDSIRNVIEKKQADLLSTLFPSFSGYDIEGKRITSQDMDGKVVLYNFWFTTCPPCVAEIPAFNKLAQEYRGRVEFVAITFNREAELREFFEHNPYDFKQLLLTRSQIEKMNIVAGGYPTNVIVNKKGNIIFAKTGGSTNPEQAEAEIQKVFRAKIEAALSNKE